MQPKKSSNFFMVFGLILFASFGFIVIATMDYQSYHEVSYPNNNLALPNLTGKTEISTNVYRLYNSNGITVDYNIFNGHYTINGIATSQSIFLSLSASLFEMSTYTINYSYISGTMNVNELRIDESGVQSLILKRTNNFLISQVKTFNKNAVNSIAFYVTNNSRFTNLTFTIQISKGTYLLPYVVPKETIVYEHNPDYSALTEIGSVAITNLTAFINGFKVVGEIIQTLVQFQQTVVYEVSKFLIENYLKVIDFLETITDNGLIEWIKDPMKGFKFI